MSRAFERPHRGHVSRSDELLSAALRRGCRGRNRARLPFCTVIDTSVFRGRVARRGRSCFRCVPVHAPKTGRRYDNAGWLSSGVNDDYTPARGWCRPKLHGSGHHGRAGAGDHCAAVLSKAWGSRGRASYPGLGGWERSWPMSSAASQFPGCGWSFGARLRARYRCRPSTVINGGSLNGTREAPQRAEQE